MQISTQTPGTSESPKKPEMQAPKGTSSAPPESMTSAAGDTSNQTSEYLKILTRMEAMITEDGLPDVLVEGFGKAVTKELKPLDDRALSALKQLPEVKRLNLDPNESFVDQLVETIKKGLKEVDKRGEVLQLLRHQEFAKLMKGANRSAGTYTRTAAVPATSSGPKEAMTVQADPAGAPATAPTPPATNPMAGMMPTANRPEAPAPPASKPLTTTA